MDRYRFSYAHALNFMMVSEHALTAVSDTGEYPQGKNQCCYIKTVFFPLSLGFTLIFSLLEEQTQTNDTIKINGALFPFSG